MFFSLQREAQREEKDEIHVNKQENMLKFESCNYVSFTHLFWPLWGREKGEHDNVAAFSARIAFILPKGHMKANEIG